MFIALPCQFSDDSIKKSVAHTISNNSQRKRFHLAEKEPNRLPSPKLDKVSDQHYISVIETLIQKLSAKNEIAQH